MGNSLYESIVAKLNVLVPLLGRTQVDIGLTRLGTDPFHVTAVQMAQALNGYILPRIQQLTQKSANIDLLNIAQVITDPQRVPLRVSSNLPFLTGTGASEQEQDEILRMIVPELSEFDRYDLSLREITIKGRTLLVTSDLERNERGEPQRIISHVTDQTLRQKLWSEVSKIHDHLETEVERRTTELQASEEKYRRGIEGAADAILIFNPKHRIQYANDAAGSMMGYTRDELLALSLLDLIVPARRKRDAMILKQLEERDSIQLETEMLRNTAGTVPVEIHAVSLGQDRYQAIVRDITERRTAEAAIRQKEEHIRSIIENLPVVAFDRLPDGTVSYISPNVESLWGYRPEEFYLHSNFWWSCVHPEERALLRASEEKQASRLEYRFFSRRKKDYIWLNEYVRSETDSSGNQRLRGVLVDVTEQKDLQSQLFQSQKMETIGTLAAGIAHDFNNQLTGILANLEFVSVQMRDRHELAEEISDAIRAVRHCSEMTRSILTFGRGLRSNLRPISLNRVVEETVRLLTHTIPASIQIKVITNPDLWPVRADETQVQQVLMNLAVNARDSMPQGGILMIETENCVVDEEYCRRTLNAIPGKYAMISIGDTGPGIDETILPRIFEPFFTTKEIGRGSGLGLATAYGIVTSHHGWIEVLTQPGEGTNFRVLLPMTEETTLLQDAGKFEHSGGNEMILVADDEEVIRKTVRRLLQHAGYQVMLAVNGEEALSLYKQNASKIDLVILDWTMPRQLGDEVLDEIRALNPNVPVILSSGYIVDEQVGELMSRGVRFLPKPYTSTQLYKIIRQTLDEE